MKKRLLIIITVFIILIASCARVGADSRVFGMQPGFAVEFNGTPTGGVSVVSGGTHCVPMRGIFEKAGAAVFYRCRDRKILVLSRDGDMIYHTVGENTVTVNGVQSELSMPSFSDNGKTYIPVDMVSIALCPERISYDGGKINIQKYIFNNDFHKIIGDILNVSDSDIFHAERFQKYITCHANVPSYAVWEAIFRVNLGLDCPFYDNVATIENPNELNVLVNKYHRLPEGFGQTNLVNMNREYTVNDGKQYLLRDDAYLNFVRMSDAAKIEGIPIKAISAYRTEDYQRMLYTNKVRTAGQIHADNYSARPGFSEHQTGLAVDINTTSTSFEYTAAFAWLQNHAHEYGFIMRYPRGKEWITGYSYEPWHYRYVGTDIANTVHAEDITYDEYYDKYITASEFVR